jgi:hypothetical protein
MPTAARLVLCCLLAGLQLSREARLCAAQSSTDILGKTELERCVQSDSIKCSRKMIVLVNLHVRPLALAAPRPGCSCVAGLAAASVHTAQG